MGCEEDVLQWMNVNISCTATNGSAVTVNLISRESKKVVWGKLANCLTKEPNAVFGQAVKMNRRATDRIENMIDHEDPVTGEEKEMLWGLP